ncbi:type II toxin-antitoxin system PemK/MazF family toxin [Virgibacillus pantothenticus]|uniref:DZANK-type domain-containing protein n=1 Tax=Virgibacillus pantothenticus TaxID=1473 RepID=A0A0L0QV92_VIRPA|nr:type II toxin-antitoxin system PemK/MazF family toxin [Virgibacillus pantothenticus]KNE22494.1 hypothetical protein AFK71_02435 [Virgibacillus pantothenticus]MED3737252.1 type II toxin-antitoxin system PemK/MazF family toxin [Virgibacillus pantothenticus]QTY16961.1 type II toxin-antitoxin system PemK/MazF family toxin [Virgibacillus pantothenticus]
MSKEFPLHGDIYWAELGPVRGSEQDGQRPVFVASNNMMNRYSPIVLISPMTRAEKKYPFTVTYNKNDLILLESNIEKLKKLGQKFDIEIEKGAILCEQSRSVSKDRLKMKVGEFNTDKYAIKVKEAISFLYAINGCVKCYHPMRKDAVKCGKCGTIHNKKCKTCKRLLKYEFKYCPYCGKEATGNWWK